MREEFDFLLFFSSQPTNNWWSRTKALARLIIAEIIIPDTLARSLADRKTLFLFQVVY